MELNEQIILDLQNKIGTNHGLDFLSDWKGVPVMIKGYIQEVREKSIIFRIEPPDSVCLAQDEHALILHDIFIVGIQGRILALDLKQNSVELGEFRYSDSGFGNRNTVRVEPETPIPAELVFPNNPIPAELVLDETIISCQVVDISLNGFGLLAGSAEHVELVKGQPNNIKLNLLDKEINLSGTIVGVFPTGDSSRLAMSFSQDSPGTAVVNRYIGLRRAELRQEIQKAYQEAVN